MDKQCGCAATYPESPLAADHFHGCPKFLGAPHIPAPPAKPQATHLSTGKPGMQWLPWRALEEVAKVLDFGAVKYGRGNWRKGANWTEFAGSATRHAAKWMCGQDLDPESGLHHLAHAVCNFLFLLEYWLDKSGTDDREKTS